MPKFNMQDINKQITPRMELNNIQGTNHLYLYGPVISEKWYSEEVAITATEVRESLMKIQGQDLVVHLNTGGGDAIEGVAIYNLLMNHKDTGAKVDVVIDGWAASAGTIIALAGDTIKGRANTFFMIHHAWSWAIGNANDMRRAADELEKLDTNICATYKLRFKGTEEELNTLLDEETTMTAEEALKYGFYDEVISDTNNAQKEDIPSAEQEKANEISMQAKTLLDLFKENKANEINQKAAEDEPTKDILSSLFTKFKKEA